MRSHVIYGSVFLLAGIIVGSVNAQHSSFTGVIVEDNAAVRAGAGISYYVVGKLSKGTTIQVEDQIFEWFKIKPPKGVHSYVSKAFVDAKGDGSTGVVNKDRVRVKAASINGPGESYRRQMDLLKGDTVQIVGEEGGFYKITPPAGTHVFILAKSVEKTEDAPAREPAAPATRPQPVVVKPAPPKPATQPKPKWSGPTEVTVQPKPVEVVVKPAPRKSPAVNMQPAKPVVTEKPAPVVVKVPEPVVVQPSPPATRPAPPTEVMVATAQEVTTPIQARATPPRPTPTVTLQATQPVAPEIDAPAESMLLSTVEERFAKAQELPVEQRPLAELLAAYELVKQSPSLTINDKRIVYARVAQLNRDIELAKALKSISNTQQQIAAAEQVVPQTQPAPTHAGRAYDAMGRLQASVVYNGKSLPRLYRLANPVNGQTILYVRPTDAVDPAAHLGRVVGLMGEIRYDPGLRLKLLEVQRIDAVQTTEVGG